MRAHRHCTTNVWSFGSRLCVCHCCATERCANEKWITNKTEIKADNTITWNLGSVPLAWKLRLVYASLSNLNSNQSRRRVHRKIVCHWSCWNLHNSIVFFASSLLFSVVDVFVSNTLFTAIFLMKSSNFLGLEYHKTKSQLSIHPFSFTSIDGFHCLSIFISFGIF